MENGPYPPKNMNDTGHVSASGAVQLPDTGKDVAFQARILQCASAGIVAASPDGRITFVNPQWCEMLGYTETELRAMSIPEITASASHAVTRQVIGDIFVGSDRTVVEKRYRRKDGTVLYATSSISALRRPDGSLEGIVAVVVDVGVRYWIERRLQLLDAISIATRQETDPTTIMELTTRLLGEHLAVTRCAYADVDSDSNRFTIRNDWTVMGAVTTAGVYSLDLFGTIAAGNMRGGKTLVVCDVDAELSVDDGAAMFNAIGVKAIICCPLVKAGRLVAMMAVHNATPRDWDDADVALVEEVVERSWAHVERVRDTAMLQEADRRKSEFLATLAHELRNPLAPISSGLQFMKLNEHDLSRWATVREVMTRQVAHMVRLIDDLLDLSRISRGLITLQCAQVDLSEIVALAVETSQPLIQAQGHDFTVQLPEQPIALYADSTRLAQALSNLLNNAAKYTPPGGKISVSVTDEKNMAVVTVSDSGIGIPVDSLDKVFDMFIRLETNVGNAAGGLGIGLSLVRRMTELHKGTVSAHSKGPGCGSRFIMRLPRTEQYFAASADAASPATQGPSGTYRSILVVDDNADAAEMLAMLLSTAGHVVHVANDGPSGVDQFKKHLPDIVFLDLGMPGMDGFAVVRALRALPGARDTLLVALTGWGDEHDQAKTRAAGFDHHLTKPASFDSIQNLLSSTKSPHTNPDL